MPLHDARGLGPGSEVVCQCLAVRLSFPHDIEPRQRIECCCVDCREKCIWAAALGGPALPAGVVEYRRAMDLVYLTNDIVVRCGKENLRFFKLRRGSPSVNCVTACCHTTMAIESPSYQGCAILVFPDICTLSTTMIPPSARIFLEDFPPDKLEDLPASITAPNGSWREARDRPLPVPTVGQSFQELLADQGGQVEILGR